METKFRVKTINGEVIVNTINEAISFFMGYFKDFAEGKDALLASAVFSSYLLATGKITPIAV